MHADCGGSEGVVGWEDESSPVLAAVVRGVLGSCDDVMPSSGWEKGNVCQPLTGPHKI